MPSCMSCKDSQARGDPVYCLGQGGRGAEKRTQTKAKEPWCLEVRSRQEQSDRKEWKSGKYGVMDTKERASGRGAWSSVPIYVERRAGVYWIWPHRGHPSL